MISNELLAGIAERLAQGADRALRMHPGAISQLQRSWRTLLLTCCLLPAAHAGSGVTISGPIPGAPFSAPTVDVTARGYVVEEFFFEGDAHAYELKSSAYSADGEWRTRRARNSKPFRSRILVVRPQADADFNGTVIVHWQNVTAGYELGSVGDDEYLRGYAWVGVSAQKVGIDGFPGPDAAGLKKWNAARYGKLEHPGDAWSYDIFSHAGRLVGPKRPALKSAATDPMGGLNVKRTIAAGASQSAGRLRTYINGVHPIEHVFDAFIPYIDFGGTIPFERDLAAPASRGSRQSTLIRTDLGVPVIVVNSETETLAYVGARQPESYWFRFFEVAGTSHVSIPRGAAPPGLAGANWMSFQPVYAAALRHMHTWLAEDAAPPSMPRIEIVGGTPPAIARDGNSNAKGGIRLPDLTVPTASHNGMGIRQEGGNRFAFLYGQASDMDKQQLAAAYPSSNIFLMKYDAALDQSVKAGVILAEDRAAIRLRAAQWAKANLP